MPKVSSRNQFICFFFVGILLRMVALNQPLVDAHLVRQAQTADWTFHAIREPSLPLSAEVSWRGDTHARLTLEFPIYNYLVMAVWRILGNLDIAGKIVSIALWAASFYVLQKIWDKLLDLRQKFWANLLFVLSPLSVFFGQAFMPEMCIQLLAFVILHQLLLYQDTGRVSHYFLFALAGLAGLLVKSLEISHLYLVAFLVFWKKDGPKLFFQPKHWIGGIVTLSIYLLWTRYVDRVNRPDFPAWTASALSKAFLGTWQERLDWHFYFKLLAYVAAFVSGPIGLLICGAAFGQKNNRNALGFWWLYSLTFFYLVWGLKTAGVHSYYNLPSLGPICFLFGLGMPVALDYLKALTGNRTILRTITVFGLQCSVILPLIGCSLYLFRKDLTILQAAQWVKEHSGVDEMVYLRVNHRRDNNGYAEYPVFSYYANRRTWIDSPFLGDANRRRAFSASEWAVITRPPTAITWAEKVRDKIARYPALTDLPDWLGRESGFVPVHTDDKFIVYHKISSGIPASTSAGAQ